MRRIALAATFLALTAMPLPAADEEGNCWRAWQGVDGNANGLLDPEEVGDDRLAKPGMSRDQYLSQCAGNEVNETGTSSQPAARDAATQDYPLDRGKGDLTPSKTTLPEATVRKRLEQSGFRNVDGLALGSDGIWRGTADGPSGRMAVAVDGQGDLIAK